MSWINRFIVRIGSLAAAALIGAAVCALPARADDALTASYQGRTIRFTHVSMQSGALAIGVNDPGLTTLLREAGATLTWKPGERYVLITNSVPVVVSFAIGDRRYDIGPISLKADFAPFERDDEAYLPLRELLRGLDLAMRQDGNVAVLQPQLSVLDVRQEGARLTVLAHGGSPLHAQVVSQSPSSITYSFDGVGTALVGTRQVNAGGVHSVAIAASGSARQPSTLITVAFDPGTVLSAPENTDDRDVVLVFGAGQTAEGTAPQPETNPQTAAPGAGAALVTGVSVDNAGDGIAVSIAVSGNASYEWHRLREPDNRFWIDISNAQLQNAPVDQNEQSPLLSMRVRQVDPTTVRIALSLSGPKAIEIAPSTTGVSITIGAQDVADAPHSGSGSIGSMVSVSQSGPAVTPAPENESPSEDDSAWKFGPRSGYVATNPRLIVIDPGHGGSDPGTAHGGASEAQLTLDMAKRLRDILVGRGWEVKMTRETDVDVYQPNDSARDELQARDDIANKAGARLFVSIHANAFINSGPYGTTCYISKPDDVAFAHLVERQLAADGTKDDGVIKSHLYVTLHAKMPAVLIETAFLTNPGDYALLTSPAWRQKVAQEIADGIAQYAREYPVSNQPAL